MIANDMAMKADCDTPYCVILVVNRISKKYAVI